MQHVHFQPWVGAEYAQQDKRLLILGEAHYGELDMPPNATIEYTQSYADGEISHQFWTKLMRLIDGNTGSDINRQDFWGRHAFYNYIQQSVGDDARIAPTTEMFKNAKVAFEEVLEALKPTHILVVSKRLWENLPETQENLEIAVADTKHPVKIFEFNGNKAYATYVNHPSSGGFSYQQWLPVVEGLMALKSENQSDAKSNEFKNNILRAVPCGTSLKLNKKYGIYFHPTARNYRKHGYVGIYSDKKIQGVFKIESIFDVHIFDGIFTKTFIEGEDTDRFDEKIKAIIEEAKDECGYDVETEHRFFCGDLVETNFKKVSEGGLLGTKFFDLDKIVGDFKDTKDLAEKLSQKEWE